MRDHSVDRSRFHRVVGTKHKKSDNSFMAAEVGVLSDGEFRVLVLTLHKANGPTLKVGLLGHEAEQLGMFLTTVGATIKALQEDSAQERFPQEAEDCWGQPNKSDGTSRGWIWEPNDAA